MKPIRVGVIGCGQISRRHLRRLVEDPRVEVSLLADPDPLRAEALRRRFAPNARVETDEVAALDPAHIDVAVLCSPTTIHHRQALLALENQLDVLVEKPLASSRAEIRELIAARDRSDRLLGVAYQRRFEPIYLTARRELTDHRESYGPIHEIHVFVCERWAQTIAGTWRDDPAFSGGYFADAGSHQIDAVFFMTGLAPRSLRAEIDRRGLQVAIGTRVDARLTHDVTLRAHFVGNANHWREDIVIHAERADLVLRNGEEIARWSDNLMTRIIDQEAGSSPNRAFMDAVAARREGLPNSFAAPAEAADTMAAWVEGVLDSAHRGSPVTLDVVDPASPF